MSLVVQRCDPLLFAANQLSLKSALVVLQISYLVQWKLPLADGVPWLGTSIVFRTEAHLVLRF